MRTSSLILLAIFGVLSGIFFAKISWLLPRQDHTSPSTVYDVTTTSGNFGKATKTVTTRKFTLRYNQPTSLPTDTPIWAREIRLPNDEKAFILIPDKRFGFYSETFQARTEKYLNRYSPATDHSPFLKALNAARQNSENFPAKDIRLTSLASLLGLHIITPRSTQIALDTNAVTKIMNTFCAQEENTEKNRFCDRKPRADTHRHIFRDGIQETVLEALKNGDVAVVTFSGGTPTFHSYAAARSINLHLKGHYDYWGQSLDIDGQEDLRIWARKLPYCIF